MPTNYSSGGASSILQYGKTTQSNGNLRRNRPDGRTTDARQQRCRARYHQNNVTSKSPPIGGRPFYYPPPLVHHNQHMAREPCTTTTTTTRTTTASSMERRHAQASKPESARAGRGPSTLASEALVSVGGRVSYQPASSVSPWVDTPAERLRATNYRRINEYLSTVGLDVRGGLSARADGGRVGHFRWRQSSRLMG